MNKVHKVLVFTTLAFVVLFSFANIGYCKKPNVADCFFKVDYDGKKGIYTLYAGHGDITPYFLPNSVIAKRILSVCKVGQYCRIKFTYIATSLQGYANPWKIQEVISIRRATKK
jgi:hypothetical protein